MGPSLLPTATGISGAAVGEGSVPIRWEFREYSSRIAGQIIKFARVGIPYVYSPRIWDAQMSCKFLLFYGRFSLLGREVLSYFLLSNRLTLSVDFSCRP